MTSKKSNKNFPLLASVLGFVFLLSTFYFLLSTPPALAQDFDLQPDCNAAAAPGQPDACDVNAAITFIKKLIDIMFYVAIPLAAIFIVWGGFVMMTAAGNPGRFDEGKKILAATVIGIAIAFGAWLIVTALNVFIAQPYQFK